MERAQTQEEEISLNESLGVLPAQLLIILGFMISFVLHLRNFHSELPSSVSLDIESTVSGDVLNAILLFDLFQASFFG